MRLSVVSTVTNVSVAVNARNCSRFHCTLVASVTLPRRVTTHLLFRRVLSVCGIFWGYSRNFLFLKLGLKFRSFFLLHVRRALWVPLRIHVLFLSAVRMPFSLVLFFWWVLKGTRKDKYQKTAIGYFYLCAIMQIIASVEGLRRWRSFSRFSFFFRFGFIPSFFNQLRVLLGNILVRTRFANLWFAGFHSQSIAS